MTITPTSEILLLSLPFSCATPQRVKSAWASTLRRSSPPPRQLWVWLQIEARMVGVKILMVQSLGRRERCVPLRNVLSRNVLPPRDEDTVRDRGATCKLTGVNAFHEVEKCSRKSRLSLLSESQQDDSNLMPRMNWPWTDPSVGHESCLG
jgi:hypothetical protein